MTKGTFWVCPEFDDEDCAAVFADRLEPGPLACVRHGRPLRAALARGNPMTKRTHPSHSGPRAGSVCDGTNEPCVYRTQQRTGCQCGCDYCDGDAETCP